MPQTTSTGNLADAQRDDHRADAVHDGAQRARDGAGDAHEAATRGVERGRTEGRPDDRVRPGRGAGHDGRAEPRPRVHHADDVRGGREGGADGQAGAADAAGRVQGDRASAGRRHGAQEGQGRNRSVRVAERRDGPGRGRSEVHGRPRSGGVHARGGQQVRDEASRSFTIRTRCTASSTPARSRRRRADRSTRDGRATCSSGSSRASRRWAVCRCSTTGISRWTATATR